MELRQLRHFVAVVDCSNLSRAADRVAISQPALTRSIKNLEELLGVILLDRKPRGVVPTEAGLAFYHHAQVVLNACQRLTREVRQLEKGVTGTVYLGVAVMFATHVTSQVAQNLSEQHTGLGLVVNEGYFEDLMRQMLDGRLDIIFSNFPSVGIASELVLEPLLNIHAVVIAGRAHSLASRRVISHADLATQLWVIADQPHAQDSFDRYFSSEGLPSPRKVLKTNSLGLILSLVQSGKFLAFYPEHMIEESLRNGNIVRLSLSGSTLDRQAGLIYRKGTLSQAAIAYVAAEFRRVSLQVGSTTYLGS